jgi:Zn-dependent protease
MLSTRQGSLHLFRLWGINVYLHWSWFVVAVYSISNRLPSYGSPVWAAAEYVALFLIVLMHEFGHALACRQVGGKAEEIVLWPLGGIAFVSPPPRPGAHLWSIAAGPLVNVALFPVLFAALSWARGAAWVREMPDAFRCLAMIANVNIVILVFNLLPIYPLDGGQILRSLLWFPLGKARSLTIATVIGLIGGAGLAGAALLKGQIWWGIMALFLLSSAWGSFKHAQALRRSEKLPRRAGLNCPTCAMSPPIGSFWRCQQCGGAFDLFGQTGVCPHCSAAHAAAVCVDCGSTHPYANWSKPGGVMV